MNNKQVCFTETRSLFPNHSTMIFLVHLSMDIRNKGDKNEDGHEIPALEKTFQDRFSTLYNIKTKSPKPMNVKLKLILLKITTNK